MRKTVKSTEAILESLLFASRWLLAPLYFGLIGALIALLVVFFQELLHIIPLLQTLQPEKIILAVLSLIDISLAGNLVMIVMFSGYENFVSKMNVQHEDKPGWMGKIDFGGLKLKLVASIAAISAIQLLKYFMDIANISADKLMWLVIVHITFVVSGVLLAVMDYVTALTAKMGYKGTD